MKYSAYEAVPQFKIDMAVKQLEGIQGKTWSTPEEFGNLFPNFDSDVRMALPRLVRDNPTEDSIRVLNMVNFINYLGTTYGSVEHHAVSEGILPKLFPHASPDQRLQHVAQSIKKWVGVNRTKKEIIIQSLGNELGSAKDYFLSFLREFKDPVRCMRDMLVCRTETEAGEDLGNFEVDEENPEQSELVNIASIDSYAARDLEAILHLIIKIVTGDYAPGNPVVYEEFDKQTNDEGDIPDEYDFGAALVLDTAFGRDKDQKLTIFISLVKIFGLDK